MLIHTIKKALMQGPVSLTRHRIDLISGLVCALMHVRSVNLRKLACSLPGMAQIDSHYRRLQRFLSSEVSPGVFTQLIVSKLVRPDQQQLLVMDRTHWKLGRTDLNVLCVGLVYQGVSIPLEYQSLQKPGNSHTEERKRILTKVLAYLDPNSCCLVADREFIGRAWFAFLLKQPVDFVIRLRGNTSLTLDDGRQRYAAAFNERMPRGTTRYYPQTSLYGGLILNLVCHRPLRGERILLITNRTDLKQVLALYGQRWSIETTFACLKSRGFNLEDTHLTQPQRLHLLLGLLAWTMLWALLVGQQLQQRKPIPIKKHGRKAISLFRRGLDQLTQIIHQARDQPEIARQYQSILLSCT
ncbi:MAG: IS4 family transposase [bacterium]|nr:IS4 family transposase [bacterium]